MLNRCGWGYSSGPDRSRYPPPSSPCLPGIFGADNGSAPSGVTTVPYWATPTAGFPPTIHQHAPTVLRGQRQSSNTLPTRKSPLDDRLAESGSPPGWTRYETSFGTRGLEARRLRSSAPRPAGGDTSDSGTTPTSGRSTGGGDNRRPSIPSKGSDLVGISPNSPITLADSRKAGAIT